MKTVNFDRLMRDRRLHITRSESDSFKLFFSQLLDVLLIWRQLPNIALNDAQKVLVSKGLVVTTVAACEVYFRDVLRTILQNDLSGRWFERVSELHKKKYELSEVGAMLKRGVQPYEMAIVDFSFQRIEEIESIFSALIGCSLLKTSFPVSVRLEEDPSTQIDIDVENLNCFRRLLQLRHEVAHTVDPEMVPFREEQITMLSNGALCIWAFEIRIRRWLQSEMEDPTPNGITT